MKILLQNVQILDKNSPFHKKKKNVLIQNGKITQIGDKNYTSDKSITCDGMILSPGWFDLGAYVGDPGYEHREDLNSLEATAAAGGFTDIAVLPNTSPCIQTKNDVAYIQRNNSTRLVQLHAIASVTKNNKGEELTEMIDLHEAGAIAFSDGLKPIWHTDIFLKSLQYLQRFDGVLIDRPEDVWLNMFGQMNEGVNSTRLGLKGMPRIAEDVTVAKNIELLKYAGGRLHFSKVSSSKSLDSIRKAKKEGLRISAGATTYQALLDDSLLAEFDTNYKVNPPLREKSENDSLLKAIKDGTIDVLISGHMPVEDEGKLLEFDLADFGMMNLQTVASQLVELSKSIPMEDLMDKISTAPRELLGLEEVKVDVGVTATLTLFDPGCVWDYSDSKNKSKSKNSPWLGKKLTGRAVGVFNNSKYKLDV
ncbi:MAG: dihydroorotase [Flammeovirgaceae bacterium]|nr:dihydroorotase [Flammeovirgaceae bacterium]